MDKIIYVTPNFIQQLEDEVITSAPAGVKIKVKDESKYTDWLITDEIVIGEINNFWKQFVPSKISVRQMKLQLLTLGLLDKAEKLVKDNKAAQIEWEYARDIELDSPLLQQMAHALELDEDAIYKFFEDANKL